MERAVAPPRTQWQWDQQEASQLLTDGYSWLQRAHKAVSITISLHLTVTSKWCLGNYSKSWSRTQAPAILWLCSLQLSSQFTFPISASPRKKKSLEHHGFSGLGMAPISSTPFQVVRIQHQAVAGKYFKSECPEKGQKVWWQAPRLPEALIKSLRPTERLRQRRHGTGSLSDSHPSIIKSEEYTLKQNTPK